MDSNYSSEGNNGLPQNIDFTKLSELIKAPPKNYPKIATMDFLINGLCLETSEVKDPELFLRNYIYTTIIVGKHLREISKRQKDISRSLKATQDHGSYIYKKLQYFYKRNQMAMDEIIEFISNKLSKYVAGIKLKYDDLIDRNNEQRLWMFGPTYDYQYNSQFYTPEYDYSTYVKFYSIPDVSPLDCQKNIMRVMSLKQKSPTEYYKEIINTVDSNNLVARMGSLVASNFHIHNRSEIFDVITTLFDEQKYLSFISMAAIQLEGLFYELVCIRLGAKERQGTLTEKVEKAFKNNQILMQALYPYFAFDIPELRNEIAHKGLIQGRDLKLTAYELALDLNCVLSLTYKASTDKFRKFIIISDKFNEIDSTKYSNLEYRERIAECLFSELYMSDMFSFEYFWELLANPSDYEEEMNYYRPDDLDEDEIFLKDIVCSISDWVKSGEFWRVVLRVCNDMCENKDKNIDASLVRFIEKLKNTFISILDGEAKTNCEKVNAKLTEICQFT